MQSVRVSEMESKKK